MKNLFVLFIFFGILWNTHAQNGIAINNDGSLPDNSAILDVKSTEKGFLPPRLSTSARDAINNPSEGLMIFNTDVKCLQWYVGNGIWHDGCGDNLYQEYPEGTVFCESGPTEIVEVLNPATGRTWMDRNLGASQAATASNDADSYGDLYQWGRAADGHQCRNSPVYDGDSLGRATTSAPNTGEDWDGHFITENSAPNDWLQTQDDDLWQDVNGTNNPCPTGYRVPTEAELNAERLSWSSSNAAGALASPLKLPSSGGRNRSTGSLGLVGSDGFYWSSAVSGTLARFLSFSSSNASMGISLRAVGGSVRCIKD